MVAKERENTKKYLEVQMQTDQQKRQLDRDISKTEPPTDETAAI